MTLAILKNILIGCVGCSIIATPISGMSFRSPFSKGKGSWENAVYMIAKSSSGNLKLFVEEEGQTVIKEIAPPSNKTFKIKALYNNQEVKGELILCSPSVNKSDFYLLNKPENDWWWKKLDGQGANCDSSREGDSLGEKLELKIEPEASFPKEISLKGCTIKDLRLEDKWTWAEGKSLLELTCSGKSGGNVKIFNQSYEQL